MSSKPQDLTPQARIRDAAVALFGGQGFDKTTIRQIASRAGVSPGLVIHHFGSKHALREVCDEHVMAVLQAKEVFFQTASLPSLTTFMAEHPELDDAMAYLVTALREGGPTAHRVFDLLCQSTERMLEVGIAAGAVKPVSDPRAVAATLVATSCGILLLQNELVAHLGGRSLSDPAFVGTYATTSMEVFGGLFSAAYRDTLAASLQPHKKDDDASRDRGR